MKIELERKIRIIKQVKRDMEVYSINAIEMFINSYEEDLLKEKPMIFGKLVTKDYIKQQISYFKTIIEFKLGKRKFKS